MVNQFNSTGINRVSNPKPKALIIITRPEKLTDWSLPRVETENIFPASATKVMAIMRIAHSNSPVEEKPSNLLKSKCIGTVVGKKQNIIKVQWDAGDVHYDLDNPKTYFLIEFID